jgi:hypothetical protein
MAALGRLPLILPAVLTAQQYVPVGIIFHICSRRCRLLT